MEKRGRKSTAELSVVPNVFDLERLEAPPELSDEMLGEWNAIVDQMAGDWFSRENQSLLVQYCRHVVAARRISQLIEECELDKEFDVDLYDKLLKMQDRESREISSLATRMRLTQQAKYTTKRAGTKKNNTPKKPPPFGVRKKT